MSGGHIRSPSCLPLVRLSSPFLSLLPPQLFSTTFHLSSPLLALFIIHFSSAFEYFLSTNTDVLASSVGHGGENDLIKHASTEMHKKAALAKGAGNIGAFFEAPTVETDKVAASETSYVYHTVKHGLTTATAPTVLLS